MTDEALALIGLAILGLAVGSFLNVCIHRLPRGESLVQPGIALPALRLRAALVRTTFRCSATLFLGGKCRKCRRRHLDPLPDRRARDDGDLLAARLVFGLDPILVPRLVFACALVVLFAIDLEHHLLPNVITLPGIVVGLAFERRAAARAPRRRSSASLAGGGVLWLVGEAYYRYSGQEGMGGGDVKMLAMIGAFLGWKLMILTLVLSSHRSARSSGVLVIAVKRGGMKYALPYGTFLSLAALVVLALRQSDSRLVLGVLSVEIAGFDPSSTILSIRCSVPGHRGAPMHRQDCVRQH